jgi:hypothetical protein
MLPCWIALVVSLASLTAPAPPTPELSRAAFERLKTLEGTWEGRSTKGWTETIRYEVIAGGTVVMETSKEAHAGHTMATMFYMDGEDLVLVHYCIAKNQPRMKATSFRDGGRTVVFTFTGGGNLASRNVGHMDQAVLSFDGPQTVRSRWTWYQNGKEEWFEEIVQTRKPS